MKLFYANSPDYSERGTLYLLIAAPNKTAAVARARAAASAERAEIEEVYELDAAAREGERAESPEEFKEWTRTREPGILRKFWGD